MPATVSVNFRTVVHAASNGISMAFPDVCKTPAPPAPFVPIPYPNIAQSSDTASGTSQVKCDGKPACIQGSNFSKSNGDEAGSAGGGMVSSCIQGKAEFINYSFDVQFEGKGACRLADLLVHNKGGGPNTPPFPVIQPPSPPGLIVDDPTKDNKLKSVDFDDSDSE